MQKDRPRLARAALAGAAGGLLGAVAMNQVSRLWSVTKRGPPTGAEKSLFEQGGRPDVEAAKEQGRSSGHPHSVATVSVAEIVAEPILGRPLSRAERHHGGQVVHYGSGVALGALYGMAVEHFSPVHAGYGVAFGLSVWLGAVQFALPALGLIRRPETYSTGQHAFSFVSHLAYRVVTELTRGAVRAIGPNSKG